MKLFLINIVMEIIVACKKKKKKKEIERERKEITREIL